MTPDALALTSSGDNEAEVTALRTFMECTKILSDPYDIKKCAEWIKTNNLERVCLQFPDNLLCDAAKVLLDLESLISKKLYILGDTTCGSCCVDEIAAQHINADGIIHFGHACLNPTIRLPVYHVLPKEEVQVKSICEKFKLSFPDTTQKILFFYDVSYAHAVENLYNCLKPVYSKLSLTTLNCNSNVEFVNTRVNSSYSTLGRSFVLENGYKTEDYTAVYWGESGKTMTILALGIVVSKWFYLSDNRFTELQTLDTPWLRRRRYLIEKLKDAKVVGIVVATLGIKSYLSAINIIKSILKEKNKKSYIISIGKINPVKLANFPEIDVFVVITCPENEVFDSKEFLKPLVIPYEVELAFNSSREYCAQYFMDFRQILPGGANYVDFKPSNEADVSLISSNLRNCKTDVCVDKMNALALRPEGTVAIGKAGAEFLQSRSWKGVEQNLGKNSVSPVVKGRIGLASHYENEPLTKDD
ncbi:2-(3-amino-3-carboxypropyl)histidine synthase subunit 2 [Prorops nasuta]|uniref:2-(3-amino-3-carboxypropyl)histidine synthase subunit 2 n=1 Tax=Prorops nasuta TaxID=863751 RepID=UPI0034CFFAAF